jgi:Protein of unknown function (DUF2905)
MFRREDRARREWWQGGAAAHLSAQAGRGSARLAGGARILRGWKLFYYENPMARTLIIIGLAILLLGLLWPWLTRLGLGRLPGDVVIERGNSSFYFPIVTCIILSVVLSLVMWLFGR